MGINGNETSPVQKKIAHINIFNKLIFVIVIYSLKNECLIDMTVSYKEWKIGHTCNRADVDDGATTSAFIFTHVLSHDTTGLNDSCLKEKVKCTNTQA